MTTLHSPISMQVTLTLHDLAEAREGEYDLTEAMLRMAESGRRMAARRAG